MDDEVKCQQERAPKTTMGIKVHCILMRFHLYQLAIRKWAKYAIGDEVKLMDLLTGKYMNDEEDSQGFVHRTLPWKALKLNMLKIYNKKKDDLRGH